jgi:hypothetical protein
MGIARNCGRCGAPVPELPQDKGQVPRPVSRQAATWGKAARAAGWPAGILLNAFLLTLAIWCVIRAITDDGPTLDPNYIPPLAYAVWALALSILFIFPLTVAMIWPGSLNEAPWGKAARAVGWPAGILLNAILLTLTIWLVIAAITDNGPALDPNYIPPPAYAICAFISSIIPAVSGPIVVRIRRNRQAAGTDLKVTGGSHAGSHTNEQLPGSPNSNGQPGRNEAEVTN